MVVRLGASRQLHRHFARQVTVRQGASWSTLFFLTASASFVIVGSKTCDGRVRGRRRRAWISDILRSGIETISQWQRTSRINVSTAPVERSVRQLASRAASTACRASPLNLSRDRRGRLQELLAVVLGAFHRFFNSSTEQPFLAGPTSWSYDLGRAQPTGALKTLSARIASPGPACVLRVDGSLPARMASKFNKPGQTNELR